MISTNIHTKKEQAVEVSINPVGEKECVNIIVGARIQEYVTRESEINLFLTLGQVMDLHYALSREIEKYGIKV